MIKEIREREAASERPAYFGIIKDMFLNMYYTNTDIEVIVEWFFQYYKEFLDNSQFCCVFISNKITSIEVGPKVESQVLLRMLFIQRKQLPLFEEIISIELSVTAVQESSLRFLNVSLYLWAKVLPLYFISISFHGLLIQFQNGGAHPVLVMHHHHWGVTGEQLISLRGYYLWLASEELN